MGDLKRIYQIVLLSLSLILTLISFSPGVSAEGDKGSLEAEANRLTYEILELKARRGAAADDRAALMSELADLDLYITAAEVEMDSLEAELEDCQKAYELSLRSMYKRGEITELEVILESRELDEMWEETAFYEYIIKSEVEKLDRLKAKLSEVELLGRDMRDKRLKRQRLADSLDTAALDGRIGELEASLSEINSRLRALSGGGGDQQAPAPNPVTWTAPAPGKLLDRVPTMPPLEDFERTGMVYSGYTTSYGADFHGRSTASGVIFNMYDFTCAHRNLPFGTWLLVTFQGKQTIVQVNDRGPFVPGRVLDLSFGAAQSIGLDGVKWTEFEILIPKGG